MQREATLTKQDEHVEQLRDKNLRFVKRLTNTEVVLASLPDGKDYMLFCEIKHLTPYCASIRKKRHQFVRPITQQADNSLYQIVANEDQTRMEDKDASKSK